MIKTISFCHKYYPKSGCNGYFKGYCPQCFDYDTVDIIFCDKCKAEIDENASATSPHICDICQKELRQS